MYACDDCRYIYVFLIIWIGLSMHNYWIIGRFVLPRMCIISSQYWVVNRVVHILILGKMFLVEQNVYLTTCFPHTLQHLSSLYVVILALLSSYNQGIPYIFSSLRHDFITNYSPSLKQVEVSKDLWCHTLKWEKSNGGQVIKEDTRNNCHCVKNNKIYS